MLEFYSEESEVVVATAETEFDFVDVAQAEFEAADGACAQLEMTMDVFAKCEELPEVEGAAEVMMHFFGKAFEKMAGVESMASTEALNLSKAKIKTMGAKVAEAIKNLWLKFVQFVQELFARVDARIAAFRKQVSRVGGLGGDLKWGSTKSKSVGFKLGDAAAIVKHRAKLAKAIDLADDVVAQCASGKWTIAAADVEGSLTGSAKFYKEFKEIRKSSAVKAENYTDLAPAAAYKMAEALGEDLIDEIEALRKARGILKAIKVKNLEVAEGAVAPLQTVRRTTRIISGCIIADATFLGGMVKILKNIKKAEKEG